MRIFTKMSRIRSDLFCLNAFHNWCFSDLQYNFELCTHFSLSPVSGLPGLGSEKQIRPEAIFWKINCNSNRKILTSFAVSILLCTGGIFSQNGEQRTILNYFVHLYSLLWSKCNGALPYTKSRNFGWKQIKYICPFWLL
jgi:hypothetical protein